MTRSESIAVGQQLLRRLGEDVPVDGVLGARTKAAARAAEARHPDEAARLRDLLSAHGATAPAVHRGAQAPAVPGPGTQHATALSRVVVLLGPYLAILSGAIAAWVAREAPGIGVEDADEVAQAVVQGLLFAVGAGITWALHHRYLNGVQAQSLRDLDRGLDDELKHPAAA